MRYGNVRGTDAEAVATVVEGLVVRIAVGLGGAVSSLDDDAADEMSTRVSAVHGGVTLLERDDLREQWEHALAGVVERDDVHGLVAGRATRLLMDGGSLGSDDAARRLSLALSPGAETKQAAAWIEGFLSGGGLVLVHDETLLGVLDGWISAVDADLFTDSLPVLRRTFSTFAPAERRQIGERVRRGERSAAVVDTDDDLDHERAAQVLAPARADPRCAPMSDERLTTLAARRSAGGDDGTGVSLAGREAQIDRVLAALYEQRPGGQRGAGLDPSAPNVARWLGDIREYFPSSVVQRDAEGRARASRPAPAPAGAGAARSGRAGHAISSRRCSRSTA